MAKRRRRGVVAFVGLVAGISLAAPYALNQASKALAAKWPNNPVTTLNTGIHKGES
jgi:hypothetical protein